jgi:general secretion pathway protein H
MSATGSSAARQSGFTLIETLVALGIAVLIGAMIFPDLERTLQTLALRQTAAVVQANLRVARGEALRGDHMVAFAVDPDGLGYGWTNGPAQRAPRGVAMRATDGRPITFFPDGSSSGGTIVVSGAGLRLDIAVDPQTGAVAAGA